jgi:asparagine synthase (glutamine-hydrolysing)
MCGISGLISANLTDAERQAAVQRMNAAQSHRGPDNEGVWLGGSTCLGHRRLSIIDLSAAGNQPFFSPDNRYVIVYNGELYNYRELKLELQRVVQGSGEKPYLFKTSSDTEVVLAAYIRWGAACARKFQGMFAFAVYDSEKGGLTIVRDRFGVKPLYYYYGDEGIAFASELRAILKSGIRKFTINREALAEYAMYQTVHAPATMVKGIRMLMPGHYAEFADGKAALTQYYNLSAIQPGPVKDDYKRTCERVKELLAHSVQKRLVADVPFGAFLSGGIDSSAVVGLMAMVSSQKVRTFNVSFDESEFSESRYARLIAAKYNTVHEEIRLSPLDFLHRLPEALHAMDHPSGDGPNTYIVAKATRDAGVTMALSGIGGDELFAGYDVFRRLSDLNRRSWLNAFPLAVRKGVAAVIRSQKKTVAAEKIAELLSAEKVNVRSAFLLSRSLYSASRLRTLLPGADPYSRVRDIIGEIPVSDGYLLSAISKMEISTYLQNVLLRDTDQMGMAVALEIREPFLDHQLVEYVLGLPDEMKFPTTPKKLLVDSLGDLLPPEIVNRPKMGFTLPWQHWLKNELRSFGEKNMTELSSRGLFSADALKGLWQQFLSGDPRVPWSRIWHLVVLNSWMNDNLND